MSVVLDVQNLGIQFGGLKAVQDFNLTIQEKQIVGLIGPNGAGKTTVFNLLTGIYAPTQGAVRIFDCETSGLKPSEIIGLGMARTFQNIRLFKELTVMQNLLVAMDYDVKRSRPNIFKCLLQSNSEIENEIQKTTEASELLAIFKMDSRKKMLAKNLPYGDQRRLEILRAMATGAKLILLDEPAAGMNPQETEDLMNTIRLIRDQFGMTILLIEHDMKLVMGICEQIAVLDHGVKIAEGSPQKIQNHPKVIEAYLGLENESK